MEVYMTYLFERGKNMEIFTLLETLEDIMERSKSLPFTEKGIVDKEEVLEIIKEIRLKLPDELKQAKCRFFFYRYDAETRLTQFHIFIDTGDMYV